ncbi:MerR family transcriptional regulator [Kineococcus sp. SYSU DK001]|uniref:MerR family transcriptional regulator n=1 Tax=Kineococcus sp. SYSU DK001 TaxID=3383122 RepID=UPI003D7EA1A9
MRISELSDRSGVSTASIKYYAREGLLPAGERTGYNQTDYSEAHLERLRLIRSLIDVGGLTVAATARVLSAVDDPGLPLAEVMGVAQSALPQGITPPTAGSVRRVEELAAARGWHVHHGDPAVRAAAAVLDAYSAVGRDDLAASLPAYAHAADLVAEADLDAVAASVDAARAGGDHGDREATAQTVVVGTVLGDQLLAGLRRIAQQNVALRRYGPPPEGTSS